MARVVVTKKSPRKAKDPLAYRKKYRTATTRSTNKGVGLYIEKSKYVKLFHKAKRECKTAHPVSHILELLVNYYVNNRLLIHRKMVMVNNPTKEVEKEEKLTIADRQSGSEETIKISAKIEHWEHQLFMQKLKEENVSAAYILDLLIDFYLENHFKVKTKIVRASLEQARGCKYIKLLE